MNFDFLWWHPLKNTFVLMGPGLGHVGTSTCFMVLFVNDIHCVQVICYSGICMLGNSDNLQQN